MNIAIVSEGYTDQIVIEALVQTILEDKNQSLEPLQPKLGANGGWPLVLSYCKSEEFRESFPYNDKIIVHIDCDVFQGADIPEECKMNLTGLTTTELFEKISGMLIKFIGNEVFENYKEKIIFAVAVDCTECWFLPIYFPTQKSISNKTSGCIPKLNTVLIQKEGFIIDDKPAIYYQTISKHFSKKKSLDGFRKLNESLHLFCHQIDLLKEEIDAQATI